MNTDRLTIAFAYLRLSREEARGGESSSITNQRSIIEAYCKQHGINLVRTFVDDGWSGGNFDRPDFRNMMRQLEEGTANTVITKDLSRLGRDMGEASYYAEQFFPEHGIRYIAIADNFDTEHENIMAPFQFAMNEVYLRDGSRKVKDVLRNKREAGKYCACPPFGYKKEPTDNNHLIPDEVTAPIVQRIFARAAAGDSSHKISDELNEDGIIPPLKYRVLYRDEFSAQGASYASDCWNHTTVKRILKNQVYLGHTVLGKSRKVSVKSKKKAKVPKQEWTVTRGTHAPLVSQEVFDRAQENMGRNTKTYLAYDHVRKSIFSGVTYCQKCGHALCSCGTVYKGEREKYWYLSCTQQRKDAPKPCSGVRIRYADLVELVRQELNALLSLTPEEMDEIVRDVVKDQSNEKARKERKRKQEKARARMGTIGKIITKLYTDNAEGRLADDRLYSMVSDLEKEAADLNAFLADAEEPNPEEEVLSNYERFFDLVRQYTHIEELDRETVQTFIERIEVGPKLLPDGTEKIIHRNQPYQQSIRIFYKFIGEMEGEPVRDMPQAVNI